MAPKNILLIGGHGRTAQLLTPLLLARSWNVTSLIRTEAQRDAILQLGKGQPGKIDVLIIDLETVKTEDDARVIIDRARPDYVVWAAGMCELYIQYFSVHVDPSYRYLCVSNEPLDIFNFICCIWVIHL